ncbi:LamG-like jellyroll fold domain-containing protein [Daejeonella sp.]|uniref:LamG-like jellyroll fold domain-containing protein n=1 Tax=Daejeonella sp. TaxID=2805397 RepID=UPI0025BBC751|nr:LamG-like jellyroll fold domain-containing protein [Daejeonella sp.]
MKIKKLITLLVIFSFTLFNSCDQSNSQLYDLIVEIKSQNDQLLNEVKTLQIKSDLLIAELRLSAAKQEELLLKVTELQGQLSTILSQIDALNKQLKTQDADVQLIKNQLAGLQTQYQGIFKQLEELQKLSQILAEIEKMKTQISQLDSRYITILTGLAQNKQQLDALKTQITSVQAEITENLNRISLLTSLLSKQNVDVKDILSQITILKGKMDELKTQMEKLLAGNNLYEMNLAVNYLDGEKASVSDTTKWHYISVVFHSDRRTEIYVDGIKKVDSYRDNVNYSYSKLYLGASFYTSFTGFYNGLLDEIRVSKVVRTQKEIQDYYAKSIGIDQNPRQTLDNNTVGLWHFDDPINSKTFTNSVSGSTAGNLFGNYKFLKGISGNAIYFDGVTGRGDCNINPPESNMTIEFWFKSSNPIGTMIQPYGMYSTNIQLYNK